MAKTKLTRHEKVYYILQDLGKRIGDTVYGSAAFDTELSKTRNEINRLIESELAQNKENK